MKLLTTYSKCLFGALIISFLFANHAAAQSFAAQESKPDSALSSGASPTSFTPDECFAYAATLISIYYTEGAAAAASFIEEYPQLFECEFEVESIADEIRLLTELAIIAEAAQPYLPGFTFPLDPADALQGVSDGIGR